ncbi:MAG: hypothetical protein KDB60_17905, partial [Propionibacteriaceae bacterium]|nr:hypothetical protein [Propionibacteriaceae bacterium]
MTRPATHRVPEPGRPGAKAQEISSTDRLLGDSRIGVGLGPLDLPGPGELGDALVRIAARGPATRVGLVLADEGHWREVGVRIADRTGEIFRVAPSSLLDPRDWLREHWIDDLPVQFAIAGDRLAMLMDHRLSDAGLSAMLPLALIDVARGRPVPSGFDNLTDRPLTAALSATFGARPGRWLAVADDFRRYRAGGPGTATDPGPRLSVPSTQQLTSVMEPDQLARLRARCRGRISLGPALALVAGAAMRAVGLVVSDRAELVVDLRRYLAAEQHTLANFIAGLEIPLAGTGRGVAGVQDRMNRALAVGRPLATAALGAGRTVLAAKLPSRPAGPPGPAEPAPRPSARISMSSLGRLRAFEKLPWTVPPEQRWAVAHTE